MIFFRNLTFFQFPEELAEAIKQAIDQGTADCALKPCGPLDLSSRGFVPTYPETCANSESDHLPYYLGDNVIVLAVGGEDKILPSSAINKVLAERLAEIERKEGRKPGGRTRKQIKDDIIHELLPKALVKPYRLTGYLDLQRGLVVIDTASRKQAEEFVSQVRHALGSFPALPINSEIGPRSVLTGYVSGVVIDELSVGDNFILKDSADAKITSHNANPFGEEVTSYLGDGFQVSRLSLVLNERVEFDMDEDLVVRKFKLLDQALDNLDGGDQEDIAAEIDARLWLQHAEVGALFEVLAREFRLSPTPSL